jgi:hypothetical protein
MRRLHSSSGAYFLFSHLAYKKLATRQMCCSSRAFMLSLKTNLGKEEGYGRFDNC